MKKVIVLSLLSALCVSFAWAQKKSKTEKTETSQQPVQAEIATEKPVTNAIGEHFAKKYSVASRWNDFDVAKDAMYDLIIEYPGSDSLIFALAYLYYENQKYPSSVLVCQDLLNRNPKNLQALELAGMDYENLNIYDRALQSYESLFLLTNNSLTLYKMSFLQYELKRYTECITNVDILLAKTDADTIKVTFNDTANKPKEYPMKVALLNLKGMAYKDQSDKVNARKYFQEALAIAPDFLFAKQNMDGLK
jgi:tetratricopeptide (TPR) repeat protein